TLAMLAEHQLDIGRHTHAYATWRRFLDSYPTLRSARVDASLTTLLRRLRPLRHDPAAQELLTLAANAARWRFPPGPGAAWPDPCTAQPSTIVRTLPANSVSGDAENTDSQKDIVGTTSENTPHRGADLSRISAENTVPVLEAYRHALAVAPLSAE